MASLAHRDARTGSPLHFREITERRRARRCATGLMLAVLVLAVPGCEFLALLLSGGAFHHASPADTVGLVQVADGLTAPVGMAIPPDGSSRKFIIDQIGLIRILDANNNLLPTPFIDLRDRMVQVGIDFGGGFIFDERGLLGLAFHPQYASNGRFFVFYTAPKGMDQPADFDSETHVSEFRVSAADSNIADATSERILLRIGKPQFNHNGGQLAFGMDGRLYISVGDGGGANDEGIGHTPGTGNGQDKSTLLGKLLRIDVDSGDPYGIPASNPFVGDPDARHEIYALGLRNPWRFSFDIGGLHRLFLADVGQDRLEEINIITAGGNYGWRIREGAGCFDPVNPGDPPATCPELDADGAPLIGPIVQYPHQDASGGTRGLAVVGGYFYRGASVPGLTNQFVFADWSTSFFLADGSLLAATEEAGGSWVLRELGIEGQPGGRFGRFILGMGQGSDGELYLLSTANTGPTGQTGQVHRITAASGE